VIYYYIKLKRGISNDLIEEILNFVKGGHYIVSFVDEIEDDNELNAEVIEIEEEKYNILKNLN
jgi:uncharacterized protein (DUF2141 family)